jgi:hypothetical protein
MNSGGIRSASGGYAWKIHQPLFKAHESISNQISNIRDKR